MTKENSLRIDFLKFVCAIFVVMIHCAWPLGQPWNWTWIAHQTIFSQGLSRIAVPFFFLCSGYFLAKHLDTRQNWWRAVCKRVRTLVVPFVIWSVVVVLLCPIVVVSVWDLIGGRPFGVAALELLQRVDWLRFFGISWYWPMSVSLWYLRCLFLFVLVAPVVDFLVKKLEWKWLLVCFALAISCYLLPEGSDVYDGLYRFFSLSGLFYFSCGIYFYHHPIANLRRGGVLCAIIALALTAIKLILLANGFEQCSAMCGEASLPFILYVVWNCTPARTLPRWVADVSFPIYMMHISVFYVLGPILTRTSSAGGLSWECAVIRILVGVVGSILLAHALRRFFPRFARVAFGER
jgi:peptidoglycan/LPS O-acetylase OafA/YrhL